MYPSVQSLTAVLKVSYVSFSVTPCTKTRGYSHAVRNAHKQKCLQKTLQKREWYKHFNFERQENDEKKLFIIADSIVLCCVSGDLMNLRYLVHLLIIIQDWLCSRW
jgi:hypothetical protein